MISFSAARYKSLGRFISDREKTRKAEISRDFSAFFAPNFFQISIDPFSIFLRVEGFELPKTHFFQNFITNESNTKDLNPRQGWGLFRFFYVSHKMFTNSILQNKSISSPRGFEPAKSRKMCFLKSIHLPHQRTRTSESQ